ncbi:MAG: hypothetical protein WA210_24275, partial [Burkholderiaceae bacterium]
MLTHRRHFLALAGAMPLLASWPGRAAQAPALGGRAFGSYWRLSGVGGPGAERLGARIEAIVATVDSTLSPYRADS